MVLWIILAAIAVLITLLLTAQTGLELEYDEDGVTAWLRIGAVKKKIIPAAPKKDKSEKEDKKKSKKKPEAAEKHKKGGKLKNFKELLAIITEALGKLKRGVKIRDLTLHFTFASTDDPAKAALSFGAASAGAGVIVPILHSNFRIKNIDVQNFVDFTADETRVYAHADVRITLAVFIAIALKALLGYFKIGADERKKERKTSYGKAPYRRIDGDNNEQNKGDGGR